MAAVSQERRGGGHQFRRVVSGQRAAAGADGQAQAQPPDDWNQHRGDVNNLTRYIESRWHRELTWQVVDLKAASVEDLGQTPVLYLCGSTSPLPEDPGEQQALAQKLRDYIDRGGFLFAEAYCGGDGIRPGISPADGVGLSRARISAAAARRRNIRCGMPRRMSIRSSSGRCWASNTAAAPA